MKDTIDDMMFDEIMKARGREAARVFAAEGYTPNTRRAVPHAVREFCEWYDEQVQEGLLP